VPDPCAGLWLAAQIEFRPRDPPVRRWSVEDPSRQ